MLLEALEPVIADGVGMESPGFLQSEPRLYHRLVDTSLRGTSTNSST
jgi:hypothetical protein